MGKKSTIERKLTPKQKQWNKEITRINKGLKDAFRKSGYYYPIEEIPLPKKNEFPKRITEKQIKELEKLKPRHFDPYGYWVDPDTGEMIPATEHREKVRKEAIEKRKRKKDQDKDDYFKEEIFESVRNIISSIQPPFIIIPSKGKFELDIEPIQEILMEEFEDNIDNFDNDSYAIFLQQHIDEMSAYAGLVANSYYEEEMANRTIGLAELINMNHPIDKLLSDRIEYASRVFENWE